MSPGFNGKPHGESRPVFSSVKEMLAGAANAVDLNAGDSRSGASLQRVIVDGAPHVLKRIRPDEDWLMRVSGDTACWNLEAWRSGIMDAAPDLIDHVTVAASASRTEDGPEIAFLMRDVGEHVVPDGDSKLTVDQQTQFIGSMADMHSRLWGWEDSVGLTPLGNRYLLFTVESVSAEIERGTDSPIPEFVLKGWQQLAEQAPEAHAVLRQIHETPGAFLDRLRTSPFTFLHGDWKATNLGIGADGRTILLDWAFPGSGPGCAEVGWYLAINAARIPTEREAVIEMYRERLEHNGIDTGDWWDRQLEMCLMGTMVQFGWEKALGGGTELDWWMERVMQGTRHMED